MGSSNRSNNTQNSSLNIGNGKWWQGKWDNISNIYYCYGPGDPSSVLNLGHEMWTCRKKWDGFRVEGEGGTYDAEQAIFLCLGKLSYSFLSLDHFPSFCPLCFHCCKIFWGFLNVRFLFCHHFLWDIFILFITITFFMPISLPSLSSSSCISRAS